MNISEKLDFLMNITNTRNSALGKALSFDPSYISRIRSGNRGIPKSQPFSRPVAAYFSRNIKDKYQLETLVKMIRGEGPLPIDENELEELIYDWLEDELSGESSQGTMSEMVDDISKMLEKYDSSRSEPDLMEGTLDLSGEEGRMVPVGIFYGNQGKRDSVKRFLTSLLAQKKPFVLCFYSDEDLSWIYEKPAFAREWVGLLINLIKSGSRVQIIHSIRSEFSEMMEIIKRWIPLYALGAIEPYYCPKLRDRVYRRSLFIAKGFSALISSSVGDKTEGMANFLVRNPEAVLAFEEEFNNYLSLCRPLMKTYIAKDKDQFLEIVLGKNASCGKSYSSGCAPWLWTMPVDVLSAIAKRAGSNDILSVAETIRLKMINILEGGGEITELISLPDKEKLQRYGLTVPLADMFGSTEYRYTADEYIRHLKSSMEMSQKYEGYRIIASNSVPKSVMMLTHFDADSIIAGVGAPVTVFHISHQQFSYAFYEYLEHIEKDSSHQNDRALSIYVGNPED